jgi:aconitate hydratase
MREARTARGTRRSRTAASSAHGDVVIAAITSCTNTSNPSVMLGAGLLAKKAVERGLRAPSRGSRPASRPARRSSPTTSTKAGLTPYLEQLGFYLVGYGCTTCIGNSGPLPEPIARRSRRATWSPRGALRQPQLRGPHQPAREGQLPRLPPLVVAYALAGTVDIDLCTSRSGTDPDGKPGLPARHLADATEERSDASPQC